MSGARSAAFTAGLQAQSLNQLSSYRISLFFAPYNDIRDNLQNLQKSNNINSLNLQPNLQSNPQYLQRFQPRGTT
jgi:hypothetical protein